MMDFERVRPDAQLCVEPGQHVALTGDNGSGKTKMIERFCRAHPLDTEYIAFRDTYGDSADGAYYLQLRWNTQELENHIALSEESKEMFLLSSGELRKRRIARALRSSATYLIIDNPYLGLDVRSRADFTDMLAEIAAQGQRSIILVMPGEAIMPAFIDRVVRIESDAPVSVFSEACRAAMADLPQKDLSAVKFYPSGEASEIVKCNAVSIRYGERTILKSLDWTVREGECWAVRGENGAGKPTLLSLVCADNPQAYACDIALFGHKRGSGESIWDIKKHIGYVSPEMHRAYRKNISALEAVASGFFDVIGLCRPAGEEQKALCRRWMRIFGIEALADRPYLKLSSGEQRLCLLARAFVKDPELLVLDEPMHGLDPHNCQRVKAIIDGFMARPHKTLLFVTHFDHELPDCIDHTLTLQRHDRG